MELVNGKTLVTLALIFIPWLQVETKSITCYQSSQRRIGSECGNCPSCDPGYGLSERCGYGAGENATCQPCIDGKTYNKRNRARECSGCFDCNSINRVVKRCCRVVINAVCGGCKDGYYDKHAEAGYWDKDLYELPCFPCSETKPDHPSCASYWSKRLTTPQPDREAADKTNHYKVNITDMKLEQRKGASFSYEHAVHVLIGVLCVAVLMVLLLLAFVIWNWKKLRQIDCGESGSPNPTYSGSNPECVNLAREPSSDDTEHETGGDPAGGVNEDGLDAGEKSPLLTPSKSTKMRQKSSSSLGSMNHGSEKMNKDNQNKNLFKCKPDLFRTLSDPLGSQTDLIAETKSKKDCIHAAKLRAEQSNWKAKIKSEVLQGATPDHPNISTGQSSTEVASSEDTVFDGNVSEPVNNVDVSLNRAPEVGAIGFHAYPPKSYTPSSSNLELKSLDDSNVSASLSDTPVNSLSEVSTLIIPGRNQNGYQDSEPNKHPSKNQTTSPISYIKTQIPPQCGNKLPIDCTDKRVPDQKVNNLNFGELNTAKNELRTSDMTATSFTDTASISVTANEAKMMDFGDVANTRSSQVTLPLEKDLLLNPLKYPKEKQTKKKKVPTATLR